MIPSDNVQPKHRPIAWIAFPLCSSAVCRLLWSLAIIGGCAWLVFSRGESPWWFVFAVYLLRFRRIF